MSKNLEVEICCGSYYDTLQAWKGGAKRVELNSALHLGGLTPSLGTLRQVKKNTGLKVICMVRPRGAGFCYNMEDFEVMLEDAHILLENGADGIAFGCLTADRVQDFIRKTDVKQIHSSCKGWLPDMTTCSEDVSFSYRAKKKNACKEAIVGDYEVVDVVLVKKFIDMATCELVFEIEKEDEKVLKICYDNTALPEK